MPTGFVDTLTPVARLIEWMQPHRVLDIGVGNGRMGVLAREYADQSWNRRHQPGGRTIDGIEGHRDYLGPLHRAVYTEVVVGDAVATLEQFSAVGRRYDLGLAIDILEHFEKSQGRRFLRVATQSCAVLAVATPRWAFHQHVEENPLEEHRSFWSGRDLKVAGAVRVYRLDQSTLALFGDPRLIAQYEHDSAPPALVARVRARAGVGSRFRAIVSVGHRLG